MKNLMMITCFLGLSTFAAAFDEPGINLAKLKKEIRIFSKIVRTSLEPDEEDDGILANRGSNLHLSDFDALYLAGQGLVLRIHLGMDNHGLYGFSDFRFRDLGHTEALFESLMSRSNVGAARGALQGKLMDRYHNALEQLQAVEAVSGDLVVVNKEQAEKLAAFRREQQNALKELNANHKAMSKKLADTKSLNDAEMAEILAQARAMSEEAAAQAIKQRGRAKEIRKAQIEGWNEKIGPLVDLLLEALCEYGGTLKSLPNNEYLTLVLEEAVRDERGRAHDKFFVFKKTDLLACRDGETSLKQLRDKATTYSF